MIIGKRISGRYKILEMIGGGGMANVYLAHDMILDRDVAVKILRLDFANDEEFIRRFHREAQSATSLEVGGQAVLGRQSLVSTPWLTERHGFDPTWWNGKCLFSA